MKKTTPRIYRSGSLCRAMEAQRPPTHRNWQGMVALYALASLSPDEWPIVDDHLNSDCSECNTALRAYTRVTLALENTFPRRAPSQLSNRRLKQSIRVRAPR